MAKTIEEWVKIGEITKSAPAFKRGVYSRYAVMEYIKSNGDRKYKEVHIATYDEAHPIYPITNR